MADAVVTLGLDDKELIAKGKKAAKKLGDTLAHETARGVSEGAKKGVSVFDNMGEKAGKALFSKFLGAAAIAGTIASIVNRSLDALEARASKVASMARSSGPLSVRADIAAGRMGLPQGAAGQLLALGEGGVALGEQLAERRINGKQAIAAINAYGSGTVTAAEAVDMARSPKRLAKTVAERTTMLSQKSREQLGAWRSEALGEAGLDDQYWEKGIKERKVEERMKAFALDSPVSDALMFDWIKRDKFHSDIDAETPGTVEHNNAEILRQAESAPQRTTSIFGLAQDLLRVTTTRQQNYSGASDRNEP
jgi:hypothetical protein